MAIKKTFSPIHGQMAHKGFSLLELLVTIAIVTLITAIIMVRYSSFDSSILLNNQAYEIALDVRETQVRAVSIRAGKDSLGGDSFDYGYGLYFANPTEYILFQDMNNDGMYASGTDSVIETLTIDPRFLIGSIEYEGGTTNSASIVFRRPNFDAQIKREGNTPVSWIQLNISPIRNSSAVKRVIVYSSGQISVQ